MLQSLRERRRVINAEQDNMEFVMNLCTRILVLAEGRLIAQGDCKACGTIESDRGVIPWPLTRTPTQRPWSPGHGTPRSSTARLSRCGATYCDRLKRRRQVDRLQDHLWDVEGSIRSIHFDGADVTNPSLCEF